MDPDGLRRALLPRFRIESVLGEGGMAVVFEALQTDLDRRVALKVLLAEELTDPEQAARMMQEARLAARVAHPAVVKVFDTGTVGRLPYIVYELVAGQTLRARMGESELMELARIQDYVHAIAGGLGAIHAEGIIHRDLKPENILVGPGGPQIADLGIAKDISASRIETRTGILLGTPLYMSPEQIRGNASLTPASDVYSLGIILYELLTGTVPFAHARISDIFQAHLEAVPRPPEEFRPGIPPELADLAMECLRKDPTARPTAGEIQRRTAFMPDAPGPRRGASPTLNRARTELARREDRAAPRAATQRTRVLGAPAPAGRKPGVVVLWIFCGLLVAGVAALARRPRPSPREPDPGSSRALASPSAAVPERSSRPEQRPRGVICPFTLGTLREYLARIKVSEARDSVSQELQRLTGYPAGWDYRRWRRWLKLNIWLETGNPEELPEPQGIEPELTLLGPWHEGGPLVPGRLLFFEAYVKSPSGGGRFPDVVPWVYSALSSEPDEGRLWVVLARLLEFDGRPEAARRALDRALRLLAKLALGEEDPEQTRLIIRTMLEIGESYLENHWLELTLAGDRNVQQWEELARLLSREHPELLKRLEQRGREDPQHRDALLIRDIDRWAPGIDSFEKSTRVLIRELPGVKRNLLWFNDHLADRLGIQGELTPVVDHVLKGSPRERLRQRILLYLTRIPGQPLPPAEGDAGIDLPELLLALRVQSLLEERRHREILALRDRMPVPWKLSDPGLQSIWYKLHLDLIQAELPDGGTKERILRRLVPDTKWDMWMHAAAQPERTRVGDGPGEPAARGRSVVAVIIGQILWSPFRDAPIELIDVLRMSRLRDLERGPGPRKPDPPTPDRTPELPPDLFLEVLARDAQYHHRLRAGVPGATGPRAVQVPGLSGARLELFQAIKAGSAPGAVHACDALLKEAEKDPRTRVPPYFDLFRSRLESAAGRPAGATFHARVALARTRFRFEGIGLIREAGAQLLGLEGGRTPRSLPTSLR